MEKVSPWCGQPSDRGRLKYKTEHSYYMPLILLYPEELIDDCC